VDDGERAGVSFLASPESSKDLRASKRPSRERQSRGRRDTYKKKANCVYDKKRSKET